MWISVLLDFNDYTDSFFAGFITNVADALDCFFAHQISDTLQHSGFFDLVGDFGDDDSLSISIIMDFTLGSDVETSMPRFVHVTDSIDSVNGGPCWEIRSLQMLHVFADVDVWRCLWISIFLALLKNSVNV